MGSLRVLPESAPFSIGSDGTIRVKNSAVLDRETNERIVFQVNLRHRLIHFNNPSEKNMTQIIHYCFILHKCRIHCLWPFNWSVKGQRFSEESNKIYANVKTLTWVFSMNMCQPGWTGVRQGFAFQSKQGYQLETVSPTIEALVLQCLMRWKQQLIKSDCKTASNFLAGTA